MIANGDDPDELRVMGTKPVERIVPEECYRQPGKGLEKKNRKAEVTRSRSC